MTNTPTPTDRPYHEIPNIHVLESAEQFHSGYTSLIGQGAGAGVLLPALHCASIALELYLKSLSAREVELPDSTFPDLVFIHAKTAKNSHRLEKLYDLAPADWQAALDAEVKKRPRLQQYAGARPALAERNPMFMASRYVFEAHQTLDGIEINTLNELLDAVAAGVRAVPSRHVM
jgi:hypothetical protein